ncbi:expressed unknown protein [Seminavis robusta]|uniref:Uncharacterized protein n=1 Tax=Seminavis robusta TaxID=568900 RepID=A0A9N8DJ70_9STRA|nr:expressed unknown protein [Seminavis robusta]|eukprot:Sro111_g055420.1 n/a (449) ;mRNA; f:101013-102359
MKFQFPKLKRIRLEDDDTASTASTGSSFSGDCGSYYAVDMKLPWELPPSDPAKFCQAWTPLSLEQRMKNLERSQEMSKKYEAHREGKVYRPDEFAVGSSTCEQDQIFFKQDTGLWQCVHEAWMNHWNLRTSPDDWWHPVACRIAKAVASAAKEGRCGDKTSQKIRDFFVTHQGKETISVHIDAQYLEDADYESVFQQFSSELEDRIKVPEYAELMQGDFTTTTANHKIASQINLMSSLKEFFEYKLVFMGCGIKAIEMYGNESDWGRLDEKLSALKKTIEPILGHLRLPRDFWEHASKVFQNLALTRKDPTNPEVIEFWSQVITKTQHWEPGGFYGMGKGKKQVDAYDGWLVQFLTGQSVIRKRDVGSESMSGLNAVPVKVEMTWCSPPVSEVTNVIGGTMGFQLHPGDRTSNGIPSLQPVHMWAMMIPGGSKIPRRGNNHQGIEVSL